MIWCDLIRSGIICIAIPIVFLLRVSMIVLAIRYVSEPRCQNHICVHVCRASKNGVMWGKSQLAQAISFVSEPRCQNHISVHVCRASKNSGMWSESQLARVCIVVILIAIYLVCTGHDNKTLTNSIIDIEGWIRDGLLFLFMLIQLRITM